MGEKMSQDNAINFITQKNDIMEKVRKVLLRFIRQNMKE